MFDIDEIPTGMTPNGRTATGPNPDKDAKARAMAMRNGLKWKCSRVGQYVSIEICETKYAEAVDFSPCRECSTIAAHLKKKGITMPKITTEPATDKESLHVDPLAGLTIYHPGKLREQTAKETQPYVFLSKSCMTFSSPAITQFDLLKVETITIFHDGHPGTVSRLVLHLGGKVLKLTPSGTNSVCRKVSSWGLVKNLQLESRVGKRYPIKEIAPGYLEIRFDGAAA